jgi:hypothetical protein
VLPPDLVTRNKITKATNFQTVVNPVSLHATDVIHFDIEDKLKLYDVFYDRRKGEYRNLGKPIRDIVSIKQLATIVIAILLRQPDSARARPQSLLVKSATYEEIFSRDYNKDLYIVAVFIDRQVQTALSEDDDLDKDQRRNIRYYVDLCIAAGLSESATPTAAQLAKLVQVAVKPVPAKMMKDASAAMLEIYEKIGDMGQEIFQGDKAAKSLTMREAVQKYLEKKYK